jgi:hypothetical protein
MAQEALVFIERVLLAPRPVLVLQLRVTQPAAILVAVVSLTPQTTRIPKAGVTEETLLHGSAVGGAGRNIAVGANLGSGGGNGRLVPLVDGRAGREEKQRRDERGVQRRMSSRVYPIHDRFP